MTLIWFMAVEVEKSVWTSVIYDGYIKWTYCWTTEGVRERDRMEIYS